jgi:hypothetical protein
LLGRVTNPTWPALLFGVSSAGFAGAILEGGSDEPAKGR